MAASIVGDNATVVVAIVGVAGIALQQWRIYQTTKLKLNADKEQQELNAAALARSPDRRWIIDRESVMPRLDNHTAAIEALKANDFRLRSDLDAIILHSHENVASLEAEVQNLKDSLGVIREDLRAVRDRE